MHAWSGVGRYSSNLARALLALEASVTVSFLAAREDMPLLDEDIRQRSYSTDLNPFSPGNVFFKPENVVDESNVPVQLLHVPHFPAPLTTRIPLVVTLHDLMPLKYPIMSSTRRVAYYSWNRLVCRKARKIIAVSKFTAADIMRYCKVTADRIEVIYEAPDDCFAALSREGSTHQPVVGDKPYFLAFANWRFHKGLDVLLKAASVSGGKEFSIYLVGEPPKPGQVDGRLAHQISQLLTSGAICFLGKLSDQELWEYYKGAIAFVHPSREEGFGLPPLEAMSCGRAVIASDIPVSKEVLGDAALYYPVEDFRTLATLLEKVALDGALRGEFEARSREHVKQFSWRRAAEETLKVYLDALKG
jgi:glycosyltransferase involved in cell wall biosynthesis